MGFLDGTFYQAYGHDRWHRDSEQARCVIDEEYLFYGNATPMRQVGGRQVTVGSTTDGLKLTCSKVSGSHDR